MTEYLYPQNLKASANIWLWSIRDFGIIGVSALIAIVVLVYLGWLLPAALTLGFAFLTIRMEETTMLDYIQYAFCYFISTQQYFEWR